MSWKLFYKGVDGIEWRNSPSRNAVYIVKRKGNYGFVWIVGFPNQLLREEHKTKSDALSFAKGWMKAHPNG